MRLHLDGYRSVSIRHKVRNFFTKCSLILEYLFSFLRRLLLLYLIDEWGSIYQELLKIYLFLHHALRCSSGDMENFP
jgi:hypothetical protein